MTAPAIILINPQLGENIGMVARAMLNCGAQDLRIVNPRDGWPSEAANRAASGALTQQEDGETGVTVTIYDSTEAAIADCRHVYATTARPREMVKHIETAATAAQSMYIQMNEGAQCAVLFGAERSGLGNDDIALADTIITIPLNPEFTSLNLAQAVLLVTYECRIAGLDQTRVLHTGKTEVAEREELLNLVTRLQQALDEKGFFRTEDLRPTIQRNVMNLFTRTQMTSQECQTFHGIISALLRRQKSDG